MLKLDGTDRREIPLSKDQLLVSFQLLVDAQVNLVIHRMVFPHHIAEVLLSEVISLIAMIEQPEIRAHVVQNINDELLNSVESRAAEIRAGTFDDVTETVGNA